MRFPHLNSDDAWHAALPFMDAFLGTFDFSADTIVTAMRRVLLLTGIPNSTRSMTLLLRRLAKRYFVSAVVSQRPVAAVAAAAADGGAGVGAGVSSGASTTSDAAPVAPRLDRADDDAGAVGTEEIPTRETVYLLMYCAVILNGDLRNAAIKPQHKMRREVFIRNNRSIPGLSTVSEAALGTLYDEVKRLGLPVRGWEGEEEWAATHSGGDLLTSLASTVRGALCNVSTSAASWLAAIRTQLSEA